MCETLCGMDTLRSSLKTIPVHEAIGMVLAHDITEIRKGEFKGRAFRKGHIVRQEDIGHLQRLGKEHLFVLSIADDEIHEDEAALRIAKALAGKGVTYESEPKEGKINLIAQYDGLLKIDQQRLLGLNMLGDVMCSTLHNNTVVKKGQVLAGTRAIPLIVKKDLIERAEGVLRPLHATSAVIEVKRLRRPKVGIVITGNEVYYGRVKDAFAPILTNKIGEYGGDIVDISYAPDDVSHIEARLRDLLYAGADLLITTGGMSVDPDDVTRFAIRRLGATDINYGSAVLPGAMFLVAYISATVRQCDSATEQKGVKATEQMGDKVKEQKSDSATEQKGDSATERQDEKITRRQSDTIPILGIPACGMYHKRTVFDIILPRILAGERIGRSELAELGHGGLCLNCKECRYPVCPFGK